MIDPKNTLIVYIGSDSILAEKNDCLLQYSYLSSSALISSLSSLFMVPRKQILTYIYENDPDDSLNKVLNRTADKIYYELNNNEIYVSSKPKTMKILNFIGIEDILNDINVAKNTNIAGQPNIILFLEDRGSFNIFLKWSYMHLYQNLLKQFPLSLRIFNESCSSGRFIKCFDYYNQIYSILKPAGASGQINIRNFGFFVRILMQQPEIAKVLPTLLQLLTHIYNLQLLEPVLVNTAQNILQKITRRTTIVDELNQFKDAFPIASSDFEKALKISDMNYLSQVGIKSVFDLKLMIYVIRTFENITSIEFTFSELKNVMCIENSQKFNQIRQIFNTDDEFNNQMQFYIKAETLYPPVKDFKIITSPSLTFSSFRINPVTKLIAGTPLIASSIEEVFMNTTSAPIDLQLIESIICKNIHCKWLQSTSTINDRLLTSVIDKMKEKTAFMRIATEMIDIVIQRVQSSIGEVPKQTILKVIAEKRLKSLIGLCSIIPFAALIDKTKVERLMEKLELNNQQRMIIETILKFGLNESQMVTAAGNAVGIIYNTISEIQDNLSLIDAMTVLIDKEAYLEASIAASLTSNENLELTVFEGYSFIREIINVLKHKEERIKEDEDILKKIKDSLLSHARCSLCAVERLREDALNVIEAILSNGFIVMEQEKKFDAEYFINRAVAIVFENVDIGDRESIDAILDGNLTLDSHSPDVCEAVKHFIDLSTMPKTELLNDIATKVLEVVNKVNSLRKEIVETYVKTLKKQFKFKDHDFNLISLLELAAQTLTDEEAVRMKAKSLNDQLHEYDIDGIVAFSSVIARSLRSQIAIYSMSASIQCESEDVIKLSNEFIINEISAVLSMIRSEIMIEQNEGEKKEVAAVALKLFDNQKISELAFKAALQIIVKTQLQNSYPVEYVVEFMEKIIKNISNEEKEMIKKLPITITRTDIIHLIGLTRINRCGKIKTDLNAFDTSKTIDSETDEYYSEDKLNQFLPIHFEATKTKPNEDCDQTEIIIRKPLTIDEACDIADRLNLPHRGWGGDVITVLEDRFKYYISKYGLTYDPSIVMKFNSGDFIDAETEGLKILPLYNIKEFEDNVLNYGGFFARYPEYAKELIECFVQSVDDADRVVTPIYYFRFQYYPNHK